VISRSPRRWPPDLAFHPIYVSRLGKGKIVGCSFPAVRQIPPSLNRAVGGDFLLRCVAWLAEKSPTTGATTTTATTTTTTKK
jgi:hypothetical protein